MSLEAVDSLDDPRLAPYRNLKDRDVAREGDLFIAEGEHLVRRLLESDFPVVSLLVARRRADEIAPLVPPPVPAYVVPDELVARIVGFQFHSGVLACGRRKPSPRLEDLLPRTGDARPATLVVLPEIANSENLGSLIRISAAFGVDAVLLGERCCDPFWRRSARVSMGAVFRLPIVRSGNIAADLARLRESWGFRLAATVLDESALPLEQARRPRDPDRLALLFGSEAQGIHPRWLALCDQRITIPMHWGTDSLNVAVAAGVFLYHFMRLAGGEG